MKDDIDKIIKKKYLDLEMPEIQLDKLKAKRTYREYKVAIIILALIIVVVITQNINNNRDDINIDNKLPQNIVAENNINLPVATETIKVGSDITSMAFLNVDYVAIIKVNKILGYTNYSSIQNKYLWPITKLEVTVEKSLKGYLKGTIQINRDGGVISIANWEKTLSVERMERYGYNKLSKEEKEKTYINVIIGPNYGTVEQDKKYLVFLREDKETYGGLMVAAGYMEEYDEKTESTRCGNSWVPIKDNVVVKRAIEKD